MTNKPELLDGLNIHQWKAKFENANMDKSEALFSERAACAKYQALLEQAEKMASAVWKVQCTGPNQKEVLEKLYKATEEFEEFKK